MQAPNHKNKTPETRPSTARTRKCSERLVELAMPSLHIVVAVLREHFKRLSKGHVNRLERLIEQIQDIHQKNGRQTFMETFKDFEQNERDQIMEIIQNVQTKKQTETFSMYVSEVKLLPIKSSSDTYLIDVDKKLEILDSIQNKKSVDTKSDIVTNKHFPAYFKCYSQKTIETTQEISKHIKNIQTEKASIKHKLQNYSEVKATKKSTPDVSKSVCKFSYEVDASIKMYKNEAFNSSESTCNDKSTITDTNFDLESLYTTKLKAKLSTEKKSKMTQTYQPQEATIFLQQMSGDYIYKNTAGSKNMKSKRKVYVANSCSFLMCKYVRSLITISWKVLSMDFLDVTATNAYVLYKKSCGILRNAIGNFKSKSGYKYFEAILNVFVPDCVKYLFVYTIDEGYDKLFANDDTPYDLKQLCFNRYKKKNEKHIHVNNICSILH